MYAMEIETKKVWDFSKENYVNRLIQNEIDGKLVEFGSGEEQKKSDEKEVTVDSVYHFNKKIESLN